MHIGRRISPGLLAALGALLGATARPAHASGTVVLADMRVLPHREALAAALEVLGRPPVLDPNAGDAGERLKRADPAVLLVIGQRSLELARAAAPSTPTIVCMVRGASLSGARNLTGVRLEVAAAQQLGLLKQVDSGIKRVGIIYEAHASGAFVEDALKAAGTLGVILVARPVADAREVRTALTEIAGDIDVLWLMPDPSLISAEMFNYLLLFTLERKIALFGFLDSFTQAGALASVAPDYREIGRRAARLAVEVASRPAEARLPLPPPTSSPGALSVNVKTARQLGVAIAPGVLSKAQKVYP
jgi:ABC-type uncharacterized transport system substrate-binding protein